MHDHRLWRREEIRLEKRKGLMSRGFVGCIMFILALALGGALYYWLDNNYNLYRVLNIPRDWPGWVVDVVGVVILVIAAQGIFAVLGSVVWRLTGRDKKVGDQMNELLERWDDIEYDRYL